MRIKPALHNAAHLVIGSSLISAILVVAGCGGGGGGSATTYVVSGTIQGLASGNTITLSNGTDKVSMGADGSFSMPARLLDGAPYNITLSPTAPAYEYCTLANGSGTIKKADVTNIAVACTSPRGSVTLTGAMVSARLGLKATMLASGKVLVTGGSTILFGACLRGSELYDPVTGTWASTAPPLYLPAPRCWHSSTLLANGSVLVTGGGDPSGIWSSSELYDAASGTWSQTGSMTNERFDHAATLLEDGKVLVTGGRDRNGVVIATAELYDPALGTWTTTASLPAPRYIHTSTRLANGKVLIAGGSDSAFNPVASSELYDPAMGTWTAAASMATARAEHTATILPNGKVLVAGGGNTVAPSFEVQSCEIYDPTTGTWSPTGSLGTARKNHQATLLLSGKVFVSGGYGFSRMGGAALSSNELYDPATGIWTPTGSLLAVRWNHAATLLQDGKVLVTGGSDTAFTPVADSEIYW